jgi:tripartite-type tricarboxylate transporter receptor subunit TctC
MLSGRVPFYASVMNSISGPVENGQLRAYAISNANRSALLPDMPTVAERGFPGFAVDNWIGIFAPAGVPIEIVTKLNREINDVLKLPEIRQKMATQLIEPVGGPPEKLGEAVKSDVPRYARILNELGIEKFK